MGCCVEDERPQNSGCIARSTRARSATNNRGGIRRGCASVRGLEKHGGLAHWREFKSLSAHVSIGGPLWTIKGWEGGLTDVTVTIDTRVEHTTFESFTAPNLCAIFEVGPKRVTSETTSGEQVQELRDARASFKGFVRTTSWERTHLGYFPGYALWNYLTTPFLFTFPGVEAREIEPSREAGQTWRRLAVHFPESVATHNPRQVFYFDTDGQQRRMDYVTEILGSTLVTHYSSRHRSFGGIVVPTRRRVFRRNPDNTSNLNMPSITIDIQNVMLQ
jgi:hypothetical protein